MISGLGIGVVRVKYPIHLKEDPTKVSTTTPYKFMINGLGIGVVRVKYPIHLKKDLTKVSSIMP